MGGFKLFGVWIDVEMERDNFIGDFDDQTNNFKKNGNKVLKRKAELAWLAEPQMPIEIRRKIEEMAGVEANPIWFGYKQLYKTDLSGRHRRLFFPRELKSILTDEERSELSKERNAGTMNITVIDPRGEVCENVMFKIWGSLKQPVLMKPWYELAMENGFQEGDTLQIWTFRITNQNNKLCFVLNVART